MTRAFSTHVIEYLQIREKETKYRRPSDTSQLFGEISSPFHDGRSKRSRFKNIFRHSRDLFVNRGIWFRFPALLEHIFPFTRKFHVKGGRGGRYEVYLNGIRSFYHVYSLISAARRTEIVSKFFAGGRTKPQAIVF